MDDSLISARMRDLTRRCERTARPCFSAFLDGAQRAEAEDALGAAARFFGGYDGAERTMAGVFPDWEEPDDGAFPISVIKITAGFTKELTHRDCLGVIMSQGIDRSKTGDIIIDGRTAYVFVCADIAPYLAENIKKIGNQGVKTELCSVSDAALPEKKREKIGAVCASRRLDAVVGALCSLSRAQSARLINSELVKVNYRECTDVSYNVKENDLLSVRGHGRFVFIGEDGETRKGRLHITAEKYI